MLFFKIILVPPDDSEMHAPSFKEGLSDLKIKDGEPLALKCVVSGDPDPQIEWFKNNEVCNSFLSFFLYNPYLFICPY